MPPKDAFEKLVGAVIADDRSTAEPLLKSDPTLATQSLTTSRLVHELPHWLYPGDTALHAAAAGRRIEIARLLLKAGANVRAANKLRAGQPLHYAADGSPLCHPSRQLQTIQLLLDSGADINAQDKNGATPLHRAVRTRCAAAVKLLLDSGANYKLHNKPGSTPFHLAVQNTGRGGSGSPEAKLAQLQIIQTFLAHGADPNLPDASGKSVFDWAKSPELRKTLTAKP
jgi:ankyrin repeat protein